MRPPMPLRAVREALPRLTFGAARQGSSRCIDAARKLEWTNQHAAFKERFWAGRREKGVRPVWLPIVGCAAGDPLEVGDP